MLIDDVLLCLLSFHIYLQHSFRVIFSMIRVRGGVRVRVGDSFRVRVRDKVSSWAKGWLGFMYYDPKLFELKSFWRSILKEKQNRAETQSAAPIYLPFYSILCYS